MSSSLRGWAIRGWAIRGWAIRRLPMRTVRLRLTVLYGTLFFVSSAALLTFTYVLVEARPPVPLASLFPSQQQRTQAREAVQRILGGHASAFKAAVAVQRADTLHQFLLASGIAIAIMALVSATLGWLVAGRTLRPLRVMATRARRISGENLHERLALPGPGDELKELGDTFDELLSRLEAAFSAQRQFVANASHELRTPLTLERAMVEVALADPDAPAQALRATCQRVLAAGARQERIIDSLLTLAQGQRGLDQREPIDLEAVAGDVLAEREAVIAQAGLRVEATLRRSPAFGDPRLAERLIANLVENALVHNVADGWVKVFTSLSGDRAVLRVSNSGPVIDATQTERLLRPFERFGEDRTGQRAGLGLAIVQAIAEAHGAVLHIAAPAQGGLEVSVSFPVRGSAERDVLVAQHV